MCCRHNNIDTAGWRSVMDGLESVKSITRLNGLDLGRGLFAGAQSAIDLGNKNLREHQALDAVARLLTRSKGTLTSLDLR
jgi:hypothetical protein